MQYLIKVTKLARDPQVRAEAERVLKRLGCVIDTGFVVRCGVPYASVEEGAEVVRQALGSLGDQLLWPRPAPGQIMSQVEADEMNRRMGITAGDAS